MYKAEQLLALHDQLCTEALEIMKKKNVDYTAGSGDPFANFRNSAVIGVVPEQGILIRVMDKLMRIRSFIASGELLVQDESVQDSIRDVINYMILLAGMIDERTKENKSPCCRYSGETTNAD